MTTTTLMERLSYRKVKNIFIVDEWDMVDSLGQMFNLSESESIKILEEVNFDFDKAVTKIQRQIQKQKEKDEKKQREKQ